MTTPNDIDARSPSYPVNGSDDARIRTRSSTSSSGRVRSASLRFLESSPPVGMWDATGRALAAAPTPMDLRRGSFGERGWDGTVQRRNSTVSEESIRRLSRQSSAQTPGSLLKTPTNPLGSHAEESEASPAEDALRRENSRKGIVRSPRGLATPSAAAEDIDDDDDPFSKFVGRGKISGQSYVPRDKSSPNAAADTEEVGDEDDSLDELDPRPRKKNSTLPKKFLDPTEPTIPKPDQKLTRTVTNNDRPSSTSSPSKAQGPDENGVYPTGYKFPPKHTWGQATKIGLVAFWKFTITPLGFLIVLYGLNVVAWGGMLFLLLIGGGQEYMCFPPGSHGEKDCNNINSPRRIWIEIDSQILNALFCVTGFGLVPWRFRDLYYLMQYRIRHQMSALRILAGIHRSWFRLPGSQDLPKNPHASVIAPEQNLALPLPSKRAPNAPLTGIRAPPTRLWKLDYVIWAYVLNTFLQIVLSGFMWALNRYDRPSWSTGTFVALACIVAAMGGLMCFQEGKKIKKVEGIPVKEDVVREDVEKGVMKNEKREKKKRGFFMGKGKEEDTSVQ